MPRLLKEQMLKEFLMPITFFTAGSTPPTAAIFSNPGLQERSADEVVAANLAREGVELAKAVRDSSWIAGGAPTFDAGLYAGTDYTAVPLMDGGTFGGFDFAPNTITAAEAVIKRSTNVSSPQLFVQGTGSIGDATFFKRLLPLNPIRSDYSQVVTASTCGAFQKN